MFIEPIRQPEIVETENTITFTLKTREGKPVKLIVHVDGDANIEIEDRVLPINAEEIAVLTNILLNFV